MLIKADAYPLARVDDCIDHVGHAKYITNLDLMKGCYAIPLTEKAKIILAIITPDGLFKFQVIPFGLKTAPFTFHWMMNYALTYLENLSIYLDDVVLAHLH